ncbi:PspC domain-containing protein [Candidatus Uabimicrobium amorphum]|uniref:Phage shock protein PspC N-terminal domain-containing protein n=1 Tax=Uabimicrobium amorphum TaxID=2596890 RepID=A0A5S9III4_UABAM|nr:PspC domain-containing protein [Candidatus Uabimicrobium amorphum]BBM82304.1 hypothetical protein UABAM_00647 [Candidatus Uabimicrobium amorphum]
MSGKYSAYYDNNFTQNAKKILQKYIEDCVSNGKKYQLAPEAIAEYVSSKVKELTAEIAEVDAEAVMDIIGQLPSAAEIANECREKPEFAESNGYAQLHLSENNRFLGGVCGGLGEYFRIDPTLIRVAFIAGSFIGGAAIVVYIILWLAFFEKEKGKDYPPLVALIFQVLNILRVVVISLLWVVSKKKVATSSPQQTENKTQKKDEPEPVKKRNFFRRVFGGLTFVAMSLLLYLPSILVLLGIASFSLWGIFYPIVDIDGFQFSFAQLSIPGVVLAISAAVLTFLLFLLVITFVGRLHFKAKVMGKTMGVFTILFIVLSIFSLGSSVAITAFQNRNVESNTVVHTIPSDKEINFSLEHLRSHVRVESLKIRGEKTAEQITVRCDISARGEDSEQAENNLQNIQVSWLEGKVFPQIVKNSDDFHFEKINIEVVVPTTKKIAIKGRSRKRLIIEGVFSQQIELDLDHSHIVLQNIETPEINLVGKKTFFQLSEVKIPLAKVNLERGKTHIKNSDIENLMIHSYRGRVHCTESNIQLQLHNDKGHAFIMENVGVLEIENHRGHVEIRDHKFIEKSQSSIACKHGSLDIGLSTKNLPQFNITNSHSRVRNKLPNFSSGDAIVDLNLNYGRVYLHPVYIDH